jgi:hypothetical protein
MLPQIQLKDLAGFSEPMKEFIRAVSYYFERRSEPTRIRNEAAAQADALRIEAQAEADASEIRQRSSLRLRVQEIQNQLNLERIIQNAARQVEALPANSSGMDEDWLHRFFIEAQEISDERLQALWSKLLSGEFQSPGRFSRRVFRLLKELDPLDLAVIEETAAKTLTITDHDGTQQTFLNVDIYEEWNLGAERERELLGTTQLKNSAILQELGIVDHRDKQFAFRVEGYLQPSKLHLSSQSAKSIRMGDESIYAEHIQPEFVRSKGPTVSELGRPMINAWIKTVILDGWRITTLGEQVFRLNTKSPNMDHFFEVKNILLKSGIRLSPNPPTEQ